MMTTTTTTNNTDTLLNNSQTNVILQKTELQDLQNKFNTLLGQYETAVTNLNTATQSYVYDTEIDNLTGQNVFVNRLVADPDSTASVYLGSFVNTGKVAPLGSNMSFKTCKEAALNSGNTVFALTGAKAGIDSSAQCLGTNTLNDVTSGGEINNPCGQGNDGNMYGGLLANAIYQTSDGKYQGCYTDKDAPNQAMTASGPVLDNLPTVSVIGPASNCPPWGSNSNFPDNDAQWIWYTANSGKGAPNNSGNPMTLLYNYQGGESYVEGQMYVMVDDIVDVYLNSNLLGTVTWSKSRPYTFQALGPIQLAPGDNFIMASVQNVGGPAGFCMTCIGPDNSVLFHTDASWKWTNIHPGKMIPSSNNYNVSSCSDLAKKFGYSYFGLQGTGEDKSQCFFSNSLTDATKYGSAIINFTESDGSYYGGTGASAVYQVDPAPDTSMLGKVGYVDGTGTVSEYPTSMLTVKKNNTYQKVTHADNPSGDNALDAIKVSSMTLAQDKLYGFNLGSNFKALFTGKTYTPTSIPNMTQQECESQCNSNGRCQAYVYNPSSKDCTLKASNAFPKTPLTYSSSTDLYYTPYTVDANASCTPGVNDIDAVQWAKYTNTGKQRTADDLCGLTSFTNEPQLLVDQLRDKLIEVTQQLIDKSDSLGSLNSDILNQIGIDKQIFYNDLEEYKRLLRKLKHTSKSDSHQNEIVRETQMSATRANYSLMLWSVLVVVALLILIYFWKK